MNIPYASVTAGERGSPLWYRAGCRYHNVSAQQRRRNCGVLQAIAPRSPSVPWQKRPKRTTATLLRYTQRVKHYSCRGSLPHRGQTTGLCRRLRIANLSSSQLTAMSAFRRRERLLGVVLPCKFES